MRPPKDPVRKKAKKAGATSEPHSFSDDYYYDNNGDPMPQYSKGRPKKTTEGWEPWQYNADSDPSARTSGMVDRIRAIAIAQGLLPTPVTPGARAAATARALKKKR